MRNRTRTRVLIAMIAVPVAFPAGCGTPSDQKTIARRQENLRHTVSILESQEAGRTARLDRLLELLARRHARDVARAHKLPAELEQALRQESRRWERNRPIHERRIREQSQGDVDNIERTLPEMFF